MNKKLIITALCLSAMTPMMAQNITGKVIDMKGEPLAFANVVLLNRTDSVFVKGAVVERMAALSSTLPATAESSR